MKPRLTGAGWLAVALTVGLHLLARSTEDRWLALVSAACAAALVSSLLFRPRARDLTFVVSGPLQATTGQEVAHWLTVRHVGQEPTSGVRWSQDAPGLGRAVVDVPSLEPGETFEATTIRTSGARGVYARGPVEVVRTGGLGLLRWTTPMRCDGTFTVWPRIGDGRLVDGAVPAEGARPTGLRGDGEEVLALRPWRPGDPTRDVSRRATARHGQLVVLERERQEQDRPALTVLACGGGQGLEWERLVSEAASCALAALRDGRRVELVAGPGGPELPGPADSRAVLDFFAGIDAARALLAGQVPTSGAVLYLRGAGAPLHGPGWQVLELTGG